MKRRKIKKDLIFYTPGKSGFIVKYEAGQYLANADIYKMRDHLEHDTGLSISYIEERRSDERTRSVPLFDL